MLTRNLYLFAVTVYFVFVVNCFASTDDLPYAGDRILVKLAPKSLGIQRSADECNQVLSSISAGEVKHSYTLVPGLTVVKLPANLAVEDALQRFKGRNEILYAEPDYRLEVDSKEPNDPNFWRLWGLKNTGQLVYPNIGIPGADIGATLAWDTNTIATINFPIAVLDTGIDYNHPDLKGELWSDGHGHCGHTFLSAYNRDDDNPMDDNFHGTAVAGCVAAQGNNNIGITGICWKAKIMALKFMDSNGVGYSSDAIKCIQYAVTNKAKVINNSYGVRIFQKWNNQ